MNQQLWLKTTILLKIIYKKEIETDFARNKNPNNYSILAVFILSIDIPSFHITENEFNHQYRHILCLSLSYVVSKLDNQK